MKKTKLLLHVCCGPCATTALERLTAEYDVTLFFYNPNLYPETEFVKRYEQLALLKEHFPFSILECDNDPQVWQECVSGYENEPERGQRCVQCFACRLNQTADTAKKNGFDLFATTLTVSPQKDTELINEIGALISENVGIDYLETDLKEQGGFQRSVELSKQFGLYRQKYCGCRYSLK